MKFPSRSYLGSSLCALLLATSCLAAPTGGDPNSVQAAVSSPGGQRLPPYIVDKDHITKKVITDDVVKEQIEKLKKESEKLINALEAALKTGTVPQINKPTVGDRQRYLNFLKIGATGVFSAREDVSEIDEIAIPDAPKVVVVDIPVPSTVEKLKAFGRFMSGRPTTVAPPPTKTEAELAEERLAVPTVVIEYLRKLFSALADKLDAQLEARPIKENPDDAELWRTKIIKLEMFTRTGYPLLEIKEQMPLEKKGVIGEISAPIPQ